ncbi:MAG: hypothetical protein AB7N80_07710 [Bdellovibrionales bacterium]
MSHEFRRFGVLSAAFLTAMVAYANPPEPVVPVPKSVQRQASNAVEKARQQSAKTFDIFEKLKVDTVGSENLMRDIPEQVDWALTDAFRYVHQEKCPGCEYTMQHAQHQLKIYEQGLSEMGLINSLFTDAIARFEAEILYAQRPEEVMHKQPYGRFLYNYILNLQHVMLKGRRLSSIKPILQMIFGGAHAGLQCGVLRAVDLMPQDQHFLMQLAAEADFRDLRPCLAAYVLPRLWPLAQVDLAERLWKHADETDKERLQHQFVLGVKDKKQVTLGDQPYLLWLLNKRDPRLSNPVLRLAVLPDIEKLPNLVHNMFATQKFLNADLIRDLAGRLCIPDLRDTLLQVIEQKSLWANSLLAGHVLVDPLCSQDQELLRLFILKAEHPALLIIAQSVLPQVQEARLLADALLQRLDWSQDLASDVMVQVFMHKQSHGWADLLRREMGRANAHWPTRAQSMLARITSMPAWQQEDLISLQNCRDWLTPSPKPVRNSK